MTINKDLFIFYNELEREHEKVSFLRFGQLMNIFEVWHKQAFGTDTFYLSNEEYLARFNDFITVVTMTSIFPNRAK